MWGDVCNSCGAHESSVRSVAKCSHCPTLICTGCKYNHEFGCAQAAQMKKYGLGPTVVRTVEVPVEEVTGDTPVIEATIPVPIQVTSQVQDDAPLLIAVPELGEGAKTIDIPALAEALDIPVMTEDPSVPTSSSSTIENDSAPLF